jgi:hypothetical protein
MLKALWIEDLDSDPARVIQQIKDSGAKAICVRTTAASLEGMLPQFQKQMGLKVYGWRWPHLFADPAAKPVDAAYWPNEMATVINLIGKGIDGYIFDIESDEGISDKDNHYQPYPKDWDNPNITDRAKQAQTFATGISDAFQKRKTPYVLGLTSHQTGFSNYRGIPWQSFLDKCTVLYPQTYWQYRDKHNKCQPEAAPIGHPKNPTGKPEQALINAYSDYANRKDEKGNLLPIIPVGGEIGCVTAAEVKRFASAAAAHNPTEIHFYVSVPTMALTDPTVIAAIGAL